jgi:hypothetical protein
MACDLALRSAFMGLFAFVCDLCVFVCVLTVTRVI